MNVGDRVVFIKSMGFPLDSVRRGTQGVVVEHRLAMDPKVALEDGRTVYAPTRFLQRI